MATEPMGQLSRPTGSVASGGRHPSWTVGPMEGPIECRVPGMVESWHSRVRKLVSSRILARVPPSPQRMADGIYGCAAAGRTTKPHIT